MRGRKPELVTDRNTLYAVISAPRVCQSRAKVELRRRLQPPAQIARTRPANFLFARRRGNVPLPLNSRRHSRCLGFEGAGLPSALLDRNLAGLFPRFRATPCCRDQ